MIKNHVHSVNCYESRIGIWLTETAWNILTIFDNVQCFYHPMCLLYRFLESSPVFLLYNDLETYVIGLMNSHSYAYLEIMIILCKSRCAVAELDLQTITTG